MRKWLLAPVRLAEHEPVTVLLPGVVGNFPPGVYDWPLSHLDYAVASTEASRRSGLNEVDVRPLKSVAVDIVGYLAE